MSTNAGPRATAPIQSRTIAHILDRHKSEHAHHDWRRLTESYFCLLHKDVPEAAKGSERAQPQHARARLSFLRRVVLLRMPTAHPTFFCDDGSFSGLVAGATSYPVMGKLASTTHKSVSLTIRENSTNYGESNRVNLAVVHWMVSDPRFYG